MSEKPKAILFDFDGTIADSEQLMLDALNTIAKEMRFIPILSSEIPQLRKMSDKEFISKRLGVPLWNIWKLKKLERLWMRAYLLQGRMPSLFVGLKETLTKLHTDGYQVGIVSSSLPHVIEHVLKGEGVSVDFVRAGSSAFGKARAIRNALREHRIDVANAVYVGDELRDVEACKKVGIRMIAVAWGLNSATALRLAGVEVVDAPAQLLTRLRM